MSHNSPYTGAQIDAGIAKAETAVQPTALETHAADFAHVRPLSTDPYPLPVNGVWIRKNTNEICVSYDGVSILVLNVTASEPLVDAYETYGYDPLRGQSDDPTAAPYGGTARYVNPIGGANTGAGTILAPWANLDYALETATAGDTIYLRGGVHNYAVNVSSTDATEANPIEVRSYPGEWAIIDGTGLSNTQGLVRLYNLSYCILRNFEVRNSNTLTAWVHGIMVLNSDHITIENVYAHHNNGVGIDLYQTSDSSVKFCTSAENYDPATGGNNADGFQSNGDGQTGYGNNVYENCVAIHNADDGFDCWDITASCTFKDCLAINSGWASGDGNGFKFGSAMVGSGGHLYLRSIALGNKRRGFDSNATPVASSMINCIGWGNLLKNYDLTNGGAAHVIKNCVSGAGGGADALGSSVVTTSIGGGFGGTVAAEDFESISEANMNNTTVGSRFFYPVDATLIDQGTAVTPHTDGYSGTAPDIGAIEST